MRFVSPTYTWTLYIRFPSINSMTKFLSRSDKCLIIIREQLILFEETKEMTDTQHYEKKALEKKVRKALAELFTKDIFNAN